MIHYSFLFPICFIQKALRMIPDLRQRRVSVEVARWPQRSPSVPVETELPIRTIFPHWRAFASNFVTDTARRRWTSSIVTLKIWKPALKSSTTSTISDVAGTFASFRGNIGWYEWLAFFSQFPPDLIDWLFFRWSNWSFSDDVVISAMFCSSEIVRWWPSSSDQFIYPQHEGSCPSAWRLLLSPYVSWSTILSASSNSTDQKAESNRGAVRETSQSSRSTTSLQRSHTSSKSILWTDSWGPTQICRASSQG